MSTSTSPIRVPKMRDHWESLANGSYTRLDNERERIAASRRDELKQVQEAPIVIEPVLSSKSRTLQPVVPPRPVNILKYQEHVEQQVTPPPSPLSGRNMEGGNVETPSESGPPPTTPEPVRGSVKHSTPIQELQAQLDSLKVEIDDINQQRDASDLKIASLSKQLDDALARSQEFSAQNTEMRLEIDELRARLRAARAEELKMNDEIREMVRREGELLQALREAQLAGRDRDCGEQVQETTTLPRAEERNIRQKDRKSRTRTSKPKKEKKKEDVQLIMVRPTSGKWRLPAKLPK
jgi:regulator of replication initiation timing